MYLSRYLKIFSLPSFPQHHLLFSTSSGAMALIDDKALSTLKQGKADDELAETLAVTGLLVEDHRREQKEVFRYFEEINRKNVVFNLGVVLGRDCNMACSYCGNRGRRDGPAMTGETAARLADFIGENLGRGKETIDITFYGGEPLLYKEKIRTISALVRQAAARRRVQYRFGLVTNGSLLTKETVKELIPFGLARAVVTLDGPPAVHDALRPFADGRGSFAAIVRNMRESTGLIRISLNANYREDNWHHVLDLLPVLREHGLGPDRLENITFNAVSPSFEDPGPAYCGGRCRNFDEVWLSRALVTLRRAVLETGYATPTTMEVVPCRVCVHDNLTVNHDGALCKCPSLLGRKKYEIGDIHHGVGRLDIYHPSLWKGEEKCRECVYLPLCYGGCRYLALRKNGHMAEVDCREDFFEATLEEFVRQDVTYQSAN